MPPTPTRRSFLAALLAVPAAAAACTSGEPRPRRTDPDAARLAAARAVERDLTGRYDALLSALPGTAGPVVKATLTLQRETHRQHLAALGEQASAPPATPPQARLTAAAVAALAAAETAAARNVAAAATAAAGPRNAQLLASVAAADASHAEALRALRVAA